MKLDERLYMCPTDIPEPDQDPIKPKDDLEEGED